MKDENELTGLQIGIELLLSIGGAFYEVFIFMMVYNWFIPLITGWQPVSYWLAFGLVILLEFITYKKSEDKSFDEFLAAYFTKIFYLSIILGIAALVHLGV